MSRKRFLNCLGRLRIRLKKNKTKSRRKGGFFSWETRKNEKKGRRIMQGRGSPSQQSDAIEIKTVPEQIIKVLALYIDKCGVTGRDLLVCASKPSRPRREGQRDPSPTLQCPYMQAIKCLHETITEVSFAFLVSSVCAVIEKSAYHPR